MHEAQQEPNWGYIKEGEREREKGPFLLFCYIRKDREKERKREEERIYSLYGKKERKKKEMKMSNFYTLLAFFIRKSYIYTMYIFVIWFQIFISYLQCLSYLKNAEYENIQYVLH